MYQKEYRTERVPSLVYFGVSWNLFDDCFNLLLFILSPSFGEQLLFLLFFLDYKVELRFKIFCNVFFLPLASFCYYCCFSFCFPKILDFWMLFAIMPKKILCNVYFLPLAWGEGGIVFAFKKYQFPILFATMPMKHSQEYAILWLKSTGDQVIGWTTSLNKAL